MAQSVGGWRDIPAPDEWQDIPAPSAKSDTEAMYRANVKAAEQSPTEGWRSNLDREEGMGVSPEAVQGGLAGLGLIGTSIAGAALGPAVATGGRLVSGAARMVNPDLVGLISPRAAAGLRLAQRVGRLRSSVSQAVKAGPHVAAAAETLIKSPQELAAAEQLAKIAQMEARRRGLLSAAGQAAQAWPK